MCAAGSTQGNSNGSAEPALGGTPAEPVENNLSTNPGREEGSRMLDDGNSYRTQFPDPDWHQIAERAADEKDPKKLAFLIKALCDRLEELKQSRFPERKQKSTSP